MGGRYRRLRRLAEHVDQDRHQRLGERLELGRAWLESQLDVASAGQRLRSTLVVLAPVLSGLGSYLIG